MERKAFLFLILILGFQSAFAKDEIVVDANDRKQIMSSIKDVEVSEMLKKTAEYSECEKLFDRNDPQADPYKTGGAVDCFKKRIENTSDPKKLEELSNKLNLQQYGLVESNNVKEIREYLTDKLYEDLTGVNRKVKNQKDLMESMKFSKMKQVDQRVFFELHKAQLGQNALFEISRFCFEKLRNTTPPNPSLPSNDPKPTFSKHWEGYSFKPIRDPNDPKIIVSMKVDDLTDSADPPFSDNFKDTDTSNPKEIYKAISNQMGEGKISELDNFFYYCGKAIVPLCDKFVNRSPDSRDQTGANACLTKSRIQDYKRAIAKTEEILKDLDSYSDDQKERFKLAMGKYKMYGSDSSDKSVEKLVRINSDDIIGRNSDHKEIEDLMKDCEGNQEACSQLTTDEESRNKIEKNLELQTAFKIAVEEQRIKELGKKGSDDLKTYLKDNGYLNLLKKLEEDPNYDANKISQDVAEEFKARKEALKKEIENKIGKRQQSKNSNKDEILQAAKQGVQDAKEEKARMAQVVLFNNIISSFLNVTSSSDRSQKGTNVGVWNAEKEEIRDEYFQNISSRHGEKGSKELDVKGSSGMGFEVLDEFLK